MKFLLLFLLLASQSFADGVYTRTVARGTVGAGGGSAVGGSGAANQVTYWNGPNSITGDNSLTYVQGTGLLLQGTADTSLSIIATNTNNSFMGR